MKHFTIFILLVFSYSVGTAQIFPARNYPQGYFRNPLAIPLELSTNFGEIRTNHFHMGFDIRTAQKENLPVYASAEGYISRVKIEKGGFGRAIYITHPNGYTTLYAHLNAFTKELDQYIKECQYENEKWEQDRVIPAKLFPVTKGQFIAFSGNTGASAGPHLHFEIRDTETENLINPWLFNFNLADNIPPALFALYLYDRRYSTYQVDPSRIAIKVSKGGYSSPTNEVVVGTPEFSFGITAEDKTNGSPFMFGIYEAEIWVDDSLRSAFRLNDLSYDEARYINGSIDYTSKMISGRSIHHLSRLPGNEMNIYSSRTGDGVVFLKDTLKHNVVINLRDAAGNKTKLEFKLRFDPARQKDLMFATNSIALYPNKANQVKLDDVEITFPDNAFYDVVPFVAGSQQSTDSRIVSEIHQLHNFSIPVHDSFSVRMKTTMAISDLLKDKVVMQLTSKNKKVAVKGLWSGDWMEAKLRELGIVQLFLDTNQPTLRPLGAVSGNLSKARAITFIVKDAESDVKSFRAELDGKWLMFSNRGDYFTYQFDEHCPPGLHELKVKVEDVAGNVTERNYSFTR